MKDPLLQLSTELGERENKRRRNDHIPVAADEHETLLCLRLCAGSEDGARRLVDHPSGLFTIAVCVMSNFR